MPRHPLSSKATKFLASLVPAVLFGALLISASLAVSEPVAAQNITGGPSGTYYILPNTAKTVNMGFTTSLPSGRYTACSFTLGQNTRFTISRASGTTVAGGHIECSAVVITPKSGASAGCETPALVADVRSALSGFSFATSTYGGSWQICLAAASNLQFTAPTDLKVGTNRTKVVNALEYVKESSAAYTITCADATNIDSTELNTVVRDSSGTGCLFTVTPRNVEGEASFRVPYSTTGSSTVVNGTIPITVGPDSNIVFAPPSPNPAIAASTTFTFDVSGYATDGDYTISCGTITENSPHISLGVQDGCRIPVTSGSQANQTAVLTIPYRSEGGHTLSSMLTLSVGAASQITFSPPTLIVGINKQRTINLLDWASDGGYTVSCGTPSNVGANAPTTGTIAGSGATVPSTGTVAIAVTPDSSLPCTLTLDPSTQGTAIFSIQLTSNGGDRQTYNIAITVGPNSEIVFTAPDPELRIGVGRTRQIDALAFVRDGNYKITCADATAIDTTELSTVIRSDADDGCSYTITPTATQGSASFTIPYTSEGGDTLAQPVSITVGPASTITVNAPPATGPNSLSVALNRTLEINASSYASEADPSHTISCNDPTAIHTRIASVTRNGCVYTVTPAQTGVATFTVPYVSDGGDTADGEITVTIGAATTPIDLTVTSDIQYTAPVGLEIGAGNTKTINLARYATDGPYTVTCGNATATDTAKLTTIARNGCDYTITSASGATQGDTTFTFTYTSSGTDTHDATVTITIGAASNIVFDAYTEVLTAGTGSIITINTAPYATDGDYTIGCSDATDIDTSLLVSITRVGCLYTARTANTPGDATYTQTYTSSGGDTHTATIHIAVTLATGGGGGFNFDFTPPPNNNQPDSTDDADETDDETDGTTDEETDETEEDPDSTTTPPQRPSTTLEPDLSGPRWNTLTAQSGGTTTQQLRENLNINRGTRIYTWNTRTQTWTPAPHNIPAGTIISFRTNQAVTDEELEDANLGAGTTQTNINPGWNLLAIPENIARIQNQNFLVDSALTDCDTQQGILAIANYSHRTRRWQIYLPCHPETQTALTTGNSPAFTPLTSITQGDTTYIYTNTRTPLTITWNTQTQTYQPT